MYYINFPTGLEKAWLLLLFYRYRDQDVWWSQKRLQGLRLLLGWCFKWVRTFHVVSIINCVIAAIAVCLCIILYMAHTVLQWCKEKNRWPCVNISRVDNAFLVSLVGMRPEKYFWLGLSNQKNVDEFVWTKGSSVTFTHWNTGMPGIQEGASPFFN